jgi:hypothetical protein
MSLETWGDDGDIGSDLPEGCMNEEQVKDLIEAINRVFAEPVYENSNKDNGISVRFLCRLQALKYYAGIEPMDNNFVADAARVLGDDF